MKIRVNNHVVKANIHTTSTTPVGGNYYIIDYVMDGASLAACHCGPMHNLPSPLDMLDAEREFTVYDYDTLDAETHTGTGWDGKRVTWSNSDRGAYRGTSGDRKAAWLKQRYTIRQKIVWALSQTVVE